MYKVLKGAWGVFRYMSLASILPMVAFGVVYMITQSPRISMFAFWVSFGKGNQPTPRELNVPILFRRN